jgi:hypothetical protein
MMMDALYWFLFLVRPTPEHADYSRVRDAFIGAWASSSDPVIAEHMVRDAIREQKWQIQRLQDWSIVSREKYKNMPGHLQHFEEALAKGYSLEYYFWPLEEKMEQRQAV